MCINHHTGRERSGQASSALERFQRMVAVKVLAVQQGGKPRERGMGVHGTLIKRRLAIIAMEAAVLGVLLYTIATFDLGEIAAHPALDADYGFGSVLEMDYLLVALLSGVTFAELCAVRMGARTPSARSLGTQLRHTMRALIVFSALALSLCYADSAFGRQDFARIFGLACIALAFMPLATIVVQGLDRRLALVKRWQRRVAAISDADLAVRVREEIEAHHAPASFGGLFNMGSAEGPVTGPPEHQPALDESLIAFVERVAADEVVVATRHRRASDSRSRGLPMLQLMALKSRGVRIVDLTTLIEEQTGRVDLDALYPAQMVFSDASAAGPLHDPLKRGFDVLAAALMLIVFAPLMLLIALGVRLSSRGPAFYRQERVGLHGRTFTLLKFRSMVDDAEAKSGPVWAGEADPRVTGFCRFLRATRLDKLPQLINVLKGDMSLVGPRRERPAFVRELSSSALPFYDLRHGTRPGLTGWAQINAAYAGSVHDSAEKLAYDIYYVKKQGLALDRSFCCALSASSSGGREHGSW